MSIILVPCRQLHYKNKLFLNGIRALSGGTGISKQWKTHDYHQISQIKRRLASKSSNELSENVHPSSGALTTGQKGNLLTHGGK